MVSACLRSSLDKLVGGHFTYHLHRNGANGMDEDAGGNGWMLEMRPLEILSLSQVGLQCYRGVIW